MANRVQNPPPDANSGEGLFFYGMGSDGRPGPSHTPKHFYPIVYQTADGATRARGYPGGIGKDLAEMAGELGDVV